MKWSPPGICDRCGQRYRLSQLKEEFLLGKPTGLRTCPSCYDTSHPQLDTRGVRTDDKQRVDDPRSDGAELEDTRSMWSWGPVGGETGILFIESGNVTVTT